jgi:hypothetical protein
MQRRTLAAAVPTFALLAWAGVTVPAGARDAARSAEPVPKLAARLTSCTTGDDPSRRTAVFTGSMPRVRDAARLAMRFDLYERRPGRGWRRLAVPNFGRWERSATGVAGFVFDKRVQRLDAPAQYRVTVRFRWYDADGDVLRHARRTSRRCVEPAPSAAS